MRYNEKKNDEKQTAKEKIHGNVINRAGTERQCLPGTWDYHWKDTGRHEGCDSLFHYGTQREQPQPDLCRGRTGNPHTAFDESKLTDPSLIIYAPVRVLGNKTIVTNGDQTDTIYEGMDRQLTFEQSLRSREFEPDAPNYTPRISGILHIENGNYNYAMSILKSDNGCPDSCQRFTFAYNNPAAGEGHFIHTYKCDGTPLPSFEGEPKRIAVTDDIDGFTNLLWESLNEDNKVSLFVRYIDIAAGTYETRIVNKNK